jgi:hypothetical protein
MSEQTLPRDPILTEEVRDLTWRIWLLENCDGVDERLKRFIAWARERDSRAVKPLRN